jgi:ubiquinone/menaquinone biosynthesis C-methylase UbiE
MVRQHAPETDWTITLLQLSPDDTVLEIGCGAGRGLELVAQHLPAGRVIGIDLSRAMVQAASRRNARMLKTGRVQVRQGDVARLSFADRHFDKVFSIHTLYFWPELERALQEIGRVLKPGGRLVVTLSPGRVGELADPGFVRRTEGQVLPSMERLGFTRIALEQGPDSRQWRTIAVTGIR